MIKIDSIVRVSSEVIHRYLITDVKMRNKVFKILLAILICVTLIECQYYRSSHYQSRYPTRHLNCTNSRHWRCIARTPILHRPSRLSQPNKSFNHNRYPYTNFGNKGIRRTYREKLNPNHQLVQKLNKLPSKWTAWNSTRKRTYNYGFHQYRQQPLHGRYVTRKPSVVYWNRNKATRRPQVYTTKHPYVWRVSKKHYNDHPLAYTKVPAYLLTQLRAKKNRNDAAGEHDLMLVTNPSRTTRSYRRYVPSVKYVKRPTIMKTKYYSNYKGNHLISKPKQAFGDVKVSSNVLRFDKKTGIALGRQSQPHPSISHNYRPYPIYHGNSTLRWQGKNAVHH